MAITPVKSSRRVLGDLTVNATFGSPARAEKLTKSRTPAINETEKVVQASSVTNVAAGRKRSIQEVIGDSPPPAQTRRRLEDPEHLSERERKTPVSIEASSVITDDTQDETEGSVVDDDHDQHVTSSALEDDAVSECPTATTTDPSLSPQYLAKVLRLRLQLAVYKMQTDQVHVPFDQLEIRPRRLSVGSSEAVASSPTLTARTPTTPTLKPRSQFPSSPSTLSSSPEVRTEAEEEYLLEQDADDEQTPRKVNKATLSYEDDDDDEDDDDKMPSSPVAPPVEPLSSSPGSRQERSEGCPNERLPA